MEVKVWLYKYLRIKLEESIIEVKRRELEKTQENTGKILRVVLQHWIEIEGSNFQQGAGLRTEWRRWILFGLTDLNSDKGPYDWIDDNLEGSDIENE